MSVLSSIQKAPVFTSMASEAYQLLLYKAMPWLATTVVFVFGLPYIKNAVAFFLWKLYEFFIQRNALKL